MFAKTIIAAAFAALAVAAPARIQQEKRVSGLVATFYDLGSSSENDGWGGGAVACSSQTYGNSDLIAAIKGGQNHCGQVIRVTNTETGKSLDLTVQDECASCDSQMVDLPKNVWSELSGKGEDAGIFPIEWHFV